MIFQSVTATYFVEKEDGDEEEEVGDGEDTADVNHLELSDLGKLKKTSFIILPPY